MKIKMDEWEKEIDKLRKHRNEWTPEVDKIIVKARTGKALVPWKKLCEFLLNKTGCTYAMSSLKDRYDFLTR